eukprot:12424261-Alexandrium_andersonii.AAC.1
MRASLIKYSGPLRVTYALKGLRRAVWGDITLDQITASLNWVEDCVCASLPHPELFENIPGRLFTTKVVYVNTCFVCHAR